LKNAVAYYSAGVVAVNSKVVGFAPGADFGVQTFFKYYLQITDGSNYIKEATSPKYVGKPSSVLICKLIKKLQISPKSGQNRPKKFP
jgi:hypothetical protein